MKEYSFQMTKEEVREICRRAMWERMLFHPFKCLLLLAILILEGVFVSWIVTVLLVLFVLVLFVLGTVRRNAVMREQLCERTQTMRVEEGMLKQDMEGGLHSEVRCSSITKVRMTRRLLMLGFSQAPKVIAWYAVPLRVFADRQDRDSFLESVRNRQTAEESAAALSEDCEAPAALSEDCEAPAAERSEQEYFCLSFPVGEEEWIRAMADATEIIQAGTLGEQKGRFGRIASVAVFSVLLCGAAWFFPSAAAILHIVSFMGIITVLLFLRNLTENPERNIRGRFRRGMVQNNVLGIWETSFTELGIRQSISGENSVMMPWESLLCAVETEKELFFYQKDKRHFGMLLKGGPECREQVESLKELCREKQVEILAGKRKKYAPNWLFPLLTAVVAVAYVWLLSGDTLLGYTWGSKSTGSPEPVGIRTFTEEEVKVTPRIEQYDFAVAMERGSLQQIRGVLPGMGEGVWYTVLTDGVEYFYGAYDDLPDKTELYGYAIVSKEYSLANGISVGMTKGELLERYPDMVISDMEGNILTGVMHMGWNHTAYPRSRKGMDGELDYGGADYYYWDSQFDYIMIADIECEPDTLPLSVALMMKDDAVAAITFYYPTAN